MNLVTAKHLARTLMIQHGLLDGAPHERWSFEWSNTRRARGDCDSRHRVIRLSRFVTEIEDEATVRNTILHEIAHALAGTYHGHDSVWQAKAMEIGCTAERCTRSSDEARERMAAAAPWVLVCESCDYRSPRYRKTTRPFSCHKCGGPKYNPEFPLKLTRNL